MKFCSPLAWHPAANMPLFAKRARGFTKTLLVMKLTVILLTAAFLNVSAKGLSQQVSFSGKNVALEDIISVVKRQTGYLFLYRENAFADAKPVTVNASNMPLREFLDLVFQNQKLKYSINSRTINIYPAPVHAEDSRKPTNEAGSTIMLYTPPVRILIADSSGAPLSGATIRIKNKKVSGMTDAKGSVTLDLQAGDVLLITYVGHESKSVTVSAQMISLGILPVVLHREATKMDEVVVSVNTGYQRIRPEQSTGAVSTISTKQYESRISTNFLDGLVNRLPGLMINNDVPLVVNGESRPLFNIRGISTMSANQNPLIVIDGYPTELTLDMIDPNEIKSVTILKDAAAATVYGVRASNGVIVIERKQATQGKPRFSFRATAEITPEENYKNYRWEKNASSTLINYQKSIYSNSINSGTWAQLSTPTGGAVQRAPLFYILAQSAAGIITPDQAAKSIADLENYDNLDDYQRLFLRSAITQTYNFNVSGGNNNALYYLTANYTGNRLSQIKNKNDNFLFNGRTTLKLTRKLNLELTTEYQERNQNRAPVPGITSFAPHERFQDVNGNPNYLLGGGISPYYNNVMMSQGLVSSLYYPLIDVNAITDKTHTTRNRFKADFNYNIGAGLGLMFGGVYETSRSDFRYLADETSSEAIDYINSYITRNTDGTLKYNIPKGGYLRQQTANTSSYTVRAQLNYDKRLGSQHNFNGIIGAEVRNLINKSNLASYFGYNDGTLQQQPVDFAAINTGAITGAFQLGSPFQSRYTSLFNQEYTEDRFLSGYSNLVYTYMNTYSLSGSIRIDQSNLFGTNPKYKYKPLWSLGVGWNIDKEKFMEDLTWVKQLKLKTSFGFNGNVAKMSLPQVIAQASMNPYTSPTSPSLKLSSYANSSLRWEQTKSFNVGIEYALSKHNISGTIDYYRKTSVDLLGEAQIDPTIGVSPSLINQATIRNNGIEFKLSADWIATKKFNWNTGLVFARNTSMVLDVFQRTDYSPQTLNAQGYVKGYPVGALFAYRYAGIDSAGYSLIRSVNGKLYHTNDSRLNSPSTIAMASDTAGVSYYMGSSIPTLNAGLSNRFDFGNIYISMMVNYYGGFKVRVPRPNPSVNRPLEGAGTYWKQKGDEKNTDVMGLAAYQSANSNYAYNYADKYVVNGDYITLADLTFSYSFDNYRFVKRAGFTHFEVKAQASNLLTVGLNEYNYSRATGSYDKRYLTPTYTLALFTNF